jgi:hypothetical protein
MQILMYSDDLFYILKKRLLVLHSTTKQALPVVLIITSIFFLKTGYGSNNLPVFCYFGLLLDLHLQ